MARILVSYYKMQEVGIQTMMYYFEGFMQELRDCGNDVLIMNTAYFNPYLSNEVCNPQLDRLLLDAAIRFDPELIIAFNHKIPRSIAETIDVPIVIWDGDLLDVFSDKDEIKKHISRYQLFTIVQEWRKEYLEFGFPDEAIHFMPNATSIRADDLYQSMNVSFVGTRLWTDGYIPNQLRRHDLLAPSYATVKECLLTNNYDADYYLKENFAALIQYDFSPTKIWPLLEFRWLTLANVLDLGLTICGHHARWEDTYSLMPQLLSAYRPRRVWTLEENNWFYNSSKLSLCPMHPQAAGVGFSWRAFDVMASNACLVVSESSELRALTKDYVDLPFYSSPYDARRLCIELLRDDDRRKSIVQASQKYVEENARWDKRIQEAESILGIKLYNPGRVGSATDLLFTDPEIASILQLDMPESIAAHYSARSTVKQARKREPGGFANRWVKKHPLCMIKKVLLVALGCIAAGAVFALLSESPSAILHGTYNAILRSSGTILCYAGFAALLLGYLIVLMRIGILSMGARQSIIISKQSGDEIKMKDMLKGLFKKILAKAKRKHADNDLMMIGLLELLAGCLLMLCASYLPLRRIGIGLAVFGAGTMVCGIILRMGVRCYERMQNSIPKQRTWWRIRRRLGPGKRIRVVFYCDSGNYMNAFLDLYKRLSEDARFDAILLAAPERKDLSNPDKLSYDVCEYFDKEQLPYIKGYDPATGRCVSARALHADYVFLVRHYDSRRPKAYCNKAWAKHSKICYIPYVACSANGNVLNTVCRFSELQLYDFLFSENMRLTKVYESMRRMYPTAKTSIRTVGSPKFEAVLQWKTEEPHHCGQTILYTPRWNTGEGTCSFFQLYEYFFRLVEQHPDIRYIFRPHPLMQDEIGQQMGEGKWDEVIARFDAYPNARVDLDPSYKQSFLDATVLVSDFSSMMYEFFILEKPVIYMHLEEVLNAFGESVARGFYHCKTSDELDSILESLRNGDDRLYERRKKLLDAEYAFGSTTAAERIQEILIDDMVQNETAT